MKRPGSSLPGILFVIAVAAALIAAIIYYMPRAPRKGPTPSAAQVPVQPAGNELQFTNLKITPSPTGGAMDLDGEVLNDGNRAVLGATVELSFVNSAGKIVGNVNRSLTGMVQRGDSLVTDEFGTDPIKPNQTRLFRITVDQVPRGWNHQMPEMKVLTVATEGNR